MIFQITLWFVAIVRPLHVIYDTFLWTLNTKPQVEILRQYSPFATSYHNFAVMRWERAFINLLSSQFESFSLSNDSMLKALVLLYRAILELPVNWPIYGQQPLANRYTTDGSRDLAFGDKVKITWLSWTSSSNWVEQLDTFDIILSL
jgi:hypothetical protein